MQGFTNAEVVGFLAVQHGIVPSTRTLKRILKRFRLRRVRRTNESLLGQIVFAILEELNNGSFMGYRQVTRSLRRKYNLLEEKNSLRVIIDPEGVD